MIALDFRPLLQADSTGLELLRNRHPQKRARPWMDGLHEFAWPEESDQTDAIET